MSKHISSKLESCFELQFSDIQFSIEMYEKIHELAVPAFEIEFGPMSEFQGFDISGIYFGAARQYGNPRIHVTFIDQHTMSGERPWYVETDSPVEHLQNMCEAFVNKIELCMYKLYPELDPRVDCKTRANN
jgi:hypothetical protein